jgi:hypothetical protein
MIALHQDPASVGWKPTPPILLAGSCIGSCDFQSQLKDFREKRNFLKAYSLASILVLN